MAAFVPNKFLKHSAFSLYNFLFPAYLSQMLPVVVFLTVLIVMLNIAFSSDLKQLGTSLFFVVSRIPSSST